MRNEGYDGGCEDGEGESLIGSVEREGEGERG